MKANEIKVGDKVQSTDGTIFEVTNFFKYRNKVHVTIVDNFGTRQIKVYEDFLRMIKN